MLKKKDIIERLAEKGYTKKSATVIIEDVLSVISEALVEGEEVMFHGFGTFYAKDIKQRETRDYQSKELMVIPAYRAPKFTAGAQLKRWVREGMIRD